MPLDHMRASTLRVEIELDVQMSELGMWPPESVRAFMAGLSEVLSAAKRSDGLATVRTTASVGTRSPLPAVAADLREAAELVASSDSGLADRLRHMATHAAWERAAGKPG